MHRLAPVIAIALAACGSLEGAASTTAESHGNDALVCEPPPFRITILPWLERGAPLPEPELSMLDGNAILMWEGPPGTNHEGGRGYVALQRFAVADSPLGGEGHPVDIPVRGTVGEIRWVGDPGVGEVRLNWLEHKGSCGYHALHLLDTTLTEEESEQYLREAAASLTGP